MKINIPETAVAAQFLTEAAARLGLECATSDKTAPQASTVTAALSREEEKKHFIDLDIPTLPYLLIETQEQFHKFIEETEVELFARPLNKHSYDTNLVLQNAEDAEQAWEDYQGQPLIIENNVAFDFTTTLIAARNKQQTVFYPLVYTVYADQVLHTCIAPLGDTALQEQAETYGKLLLEKLNHIGVFTLRFAVKDDKLYALGFTPSLDNVGYLTLEPFCSVSQFELQLRAVLNLPLPTPEITKPTTSINLIDALPDETIIKESLHYYRYSNLPETSKILGHLALSGESFDEVKEKIDRLQAYFK
jgi:5-(carboxyamino)imidazole ribonucleotide synthase